MACFEHDEIAFHYRDTGSGVPFFFQHGLGADSSQPFSLFKPSPGFRLLAFDCRAHGETCPLGDPQRISIPSFADDLLAFMDHLRISRALVGGISMGAAVALHFTLTHPDRVLGLVLSRPAWLDEPRTENLQLFPVIAQLIREHGPKRGAELFRQTDEYRQILRESPDNANSLLSQFDPPCAEETVIRLERIPQYAPAYTRKHWEKISVPTLVLANRQDPIHPFEYGETLARIIPSAEFRELTPKSVSLERHAVDVQRALEEFLKRPFAVEALKR